MWSHFRDSIKGLVWSKPFVGPDPVFTESAERPLTIEEFVSGRHLRQGFGKKLIKELGGPKFIEEVTRGARKKLNKHVVAVVGHVGAGKSTWINCQLGHPLVEECRGEEGTRARVGTWEQITDKCTLLANSTDAEIVFLDTPGWTPDSERNREIMAGRTCWRRSLDRVFCNQQTLHGVKEALGEREMDPRHRIHILVIVLKYSVRKVDWEKDISSIQPVFEELLKDRHVAIKVIPVITYGDDCSPEKYGEYIARAKTLVTQLFQRPSSWCCCCRKRSCDQFETCEAFIVTQKPVDPNYRVLYPQAGGRTPMDAIKEIVEEQKKDKDFRRALDDQLTKDLADVLEEKYKKPSSDDPSTLTAYKGALQATALLRGLKLMGLVEGAGEIPWQSLGEVVEKKRWPSKSRMVIPGMLLTLLCLAISQFLSGLVDPLIHSTGRWVDEVTEHCSAIQQENLNLTQQGKLLEEKVVNLQRATRSLTQEKSDLFASEQQLMKEIELLSRNNSALIAHLLHVKSQDRELAAANARLQRKAKQLEGEVVHLQSAKSSLTEKLSQLEQQMLKKEHAHKRKYSHMHQEVTWKQGPQKEVGLRNAIRAQSRAFPRAGAPFSVLMMIAALSWAAP